MSSYGFFCGSFGLQVLVVEQRVGDAAEGLVHANDVAAGRELTRLGLLLVRLRRAGRPGRRWFRLVLRCARRGLTTRGPCLLLHGHVDGERGRGARHLAPLQLQHPEQRGLCPWTRVVGREDIGRGTFDPRLEHRALRLEVEVPEEGLRVLAVVRQGGEQGRLLVVVVVALRPLRPRQRRVLLEPGTRVLARRHGAFDRVGAAVAKRLVQPARAVAHGGDEHQVAGRPGVERAVREGTGHPELRQLAHVVVPEHLPLVCEDGIDPRVVRPVADGVVVEVGHRLVQVVQHLCLLPDEGVEHVARQGQRQPHAVAVVVVDDVLAPVDDLRPVVLGMREVPVVDVDLAIAAVDLGDRRDQRDDAPADRLDVGALVDRETIRELHQRGGRARFTGVQRAGDVVDGHAGRHEAVGLAIVERDGARIGQPGQSRPVLVVLREHRFVGDGDGDHLAPFFRRADRDDLDARARLLEAAHVVVHLGRVRQPSWRAGDVAEHGGRRRHRLRGGQVIDQRRREEGLRRVLPDLLRVVLVDRLLRVAGVLVALLRAEQRRTGDEQHACGKGLQGAMSSHRSSSSKNAVAEQMRGSVKHAGDVGRYRAGL